MLNKRLTELSTEEDHYLDLMGDPDWPKAKLTERVVTIPIERDKVRAQLDALTADVTTEWDILTSPSVARPAPAALRGVQSDTAQILNSVIFTRLPSAPTT